MGDVKHNTIKFTRKELERMYEIIILKYEGTVVMKQTDIVLQNILKKLTGLNAKGLLKLIKERNHGW